MPWKSLSLGVSGKALTSESLSTLGKFTPGDPCIIEERDDAAHARKLNITPWRKIWNILSDFWDSASGKEKITAAHRSWYYLAMVTASELENIEKRFTFSLDGYYEPKATPMPVELYFATAEDMAVLSASLSDDLTDAEVLGLDSGIVVCRRISPCQYEIPGNIRNIMTLQNFIESPDIILRSSRGDFSVESQIHRGKKGKISFASGMRLTRRMWMTYYTEKTNQEIVDKFGPAVGYNTVRGDEYDTFMDIFFLRYVQQFGPTNKNLQLGLTIMHNFPYTRFRCRVEKMTDDVMVVSPYPVKALTESFTYEIQNTLRLPFQYESESGWTEIKPGDIIPAGVPLTKAIRVFDLKNYPNLAKDFPINFLERFHKTVVAFNSDIDYIDDIWSYENYLGGVNGFVVGDIVTGATSGAWGYIIQSMHGGSEGRLELRRVVGDFLLGEMISDEHSNSATMMHLGDPSYPMSESVTEAFLARNKRTGSDFLTTVWLEYAPGALMESTYATLGHAPGGSIETSLGDLFDPSGECKSSALVSFHLPGGAVETDFGEELKHDGDGKIETDYGMMLVLSTPSHTESSGGGYLDFKMGSGKFIVNERIKGLTSEASGIVTSIRFDGVRGTFTLRMVRGIFQDGEQVWGESLLLGKGYADGSLYS